MTRLILNGTEAILPEGFSFSLFTENPLFNKSSEYTYDITLSITNERNARIFNYPNRINIVDNSSEKIKAVLIVDNKVVFVGVAIILEPSNREIKIQLASGNSELNYFIKTQKKNLRKLDLGKAEKLEVMNSQGYLDKTKTAHLVYNSLSYSYPERNYHFLPYYTGIEEDHNSLKYLIQGNYFLLDPYDFTAPVGGTPPVSKNLYASYWPMYSGQVPQPYLCFIIQKVIEVLGYSLTYNALAEHHIFKDAYIVHGIQTLDFAKMLPDWTVEDFLAKIELQFDCQFVVTSENNTVELLFNSQLDANQENQTSIVVLDDFVLNLDNDNKLVAQNSNIEYSLDTDEDYAYASMSQTIMDEVKERKTTVRYNTLQEMIEMVKNKEDSQRFEKIFTDGYDQFIAFRTGKEINGVPEVIPKRVNYLAPLYANKDSEDIDHSFDIIPAPMVYTRQTSYAGAFFYQMPVAGNYDPLALDNKIYGQTPSDDDIFKFDIQSIVEGDTSLEEESLGYTKMRLAIYRGLVKLDCDPSFNPPPDIFAQYPISYVESLAVYFEEKNIIRYFGPIQKDPFRLENMSSEIYAKSKAVDTTKQYKWKFKFPDNFDIRDVFVIKNKKYMCNKVEKEVTINGFSDFVTGYFYPKE